MILLLIYGSRDKLNNWLVVEPYPSEKYEFVNWDDDISNIWKNKSHVPNHQPEGYKGEVMFALKIIFVQDIDIDILLFVLQGFKVKYGDNN